jgi:hypothetical protein
MFSQVEEVVRLNRINQAKFKDFLLQFNRREFDRDRQQRFKIRVAKQVNAQRMQQKAVMAQLNNLEYFKQLALDGTLKEMPKNEIKSLIVRLGITPE